MSEVIIYLRASTEEQTPENQLDNCKELLDKLKINDYNIYEDKVSAWKETDRESFDLIKRAIQKRKVKVLICWDLDRLYRNRKKLIQFFDLCKLYDCKIYSFRQKWLEDLNKIPEPFNEIMFNLMLQIMGWLAEEESNKKSERVKLAIKKKEGKTYSKFGKKWGRKSIISKKLIEDIKVLRSKGMSLRDIQKEVYYYDKNNNKKTPSLAIVHKLSIDN